MSNFQPVCLGRWRGYAAIALTCHRSTPRFDTLLVEGVLSRSRLLANRTDPSIKSPLLIPSYGEAASNSGQTLTEGLVSRRAGEI